MGHQILKKIFFAVLIFFIALSLVFLWLRFDYAPKKFKLYTDYYDNDLEICPSFHSVPTRWILKQGFETYLHQAESDSSKAYPIAVAYSLGIGTLKDEKASLAWTLKAISQNNPQAEADYGTYLYNQGDTKGLEFLNKAARAGNTSAILFLAIANNDTATLEKLAAQGNGAAQYFSAPSLTNQLTPKPFDPASVKAFNLMLAAANNPKTPTIYRIQAITVLINDYQYWQGTVKNLEAANYWNQQLESMNQEGCDPFVK